MKKTAQREQNAIARYIRETQGELRKVSWPTRREAWNLTLIVAAVILFMAIVLGGFDLLFSYLLRLLLQI